MLLHQGAAVLIDFIDLVSDDSANSWGRLLKDGFARNSLDQLVRQIGPFVSVVVILDGESGGEMNGRFQHTVSIAFVALNHSRAVACIAPFPSTPVTTKAALRNLPFVENRVIHDKGYTYLVFIKVTQEMCSFRIQAPKQIFYPVMFSISMNGSRPPSRAMTMTASVHPSTLASMTTNETLRKAFVATNNGGRMRNLGLERHGREMIWSLNGNIPWSRWLSILWTINWTSAVWLGFILE